MILLSNSKESFLIINERCRGLVSFLVSQSFPIKVGLVEVCLVLPVWVVNTGGRVEQTSVLQSVDSHPGHLASSKLSFVEISFAPGKLSNSLEFPVLELALIFPTLGKTSVNPY